MNINDIRNKLKNQSSNKVTFQSTLSEAPKNKEISSSYDEPKRIYSEETVIPKTKVPNTHSDLFTKEDKREKEPPESKIWNYDETIDINVTSPEEFVNILGLNDEVYDWKRTSKKGRKSRENFNKLIVDNL